MAKRNTIVKKIAPELDLWLKQRHMNMQKLLPYGTLTQIEAQKIIAKSDGVEMTREMIRKLKK